MKQSNKRCWSCGSFRAYYTKGYCCLFKEKNGYCARHEKITEKSDSCDKWHCRRTPKEKRIRIAVNAIPEIYHKIAIIEQLLMEESELQKLRDESD
ncbi:MAG: hypothetical protein K2O04_05185 [Clostridiales bacterium]|nr:hypothetical protein [Clostridiales bacterium]